MKLYQSPDGHWWTTADLDEYDLDDCLPVCIRHKIPLRPTETLQVNRGVCPECYSQARQYGLKLPLIFNPQTWTWRPKVQFDPRDLPGPNGFQPIPLTEDLR